MSCPTCGSDKRLTRIRGRWSIGEKWQSDNCPDAWHTATPEPSCTERDRCTSRDKAVCEWCQAPNSPDTTTPEPYTAEDAKRHEKERVRLGHRLSEFLVSVDAGLGKERLVDARRDLSDLLEIAARAIAYIDTVTAERDAGAIRERQLMSKLRESHDMRLTNCESMLASVTIEKVEQAAELATLRTRNERLERADAMAEAIRDHAYCGQTYGDDECFRVRNKCQCSSLCEVAAHYSELDA